VVEAQGAPRDQGLLQGRAERAAARAAARDAVRSLAPGLLTRWQARRRLRRGPALAFKRFFPQHHERLAGIARGAGVRLEDLELVEQRSRASAAIEVTGSSLAARFELEPALESQLMLRRSSPDAGGFESVELTAPAWASCLAGVNAEGLGAVCVADPALEAPPCRLLAQDVLLRTRTLASAIEHVRRRAAYVGSSGALVLVDAEGGVAHLELERGRLSLGTPASTAAIGRSAPLRIDAASRTLVWLDRKLRAEPRPGG
jgi:hypothetical protein